MRLIAQTDPDYDQTIKWLAIEKVPGDPIGYFLFEYTDISKPCLSDTWFIQVDDAFIAAETSFGVTKSDWFVDDF